MSAIQDHDYCAKVEEKEPVKSEVEMAPLVIEAPAIIDHDEVMDSLKFISPETSVSSLSPTHSTDSGIENCLDPVLACFSSTFNEENLDLEAFKDGEDLLDFDFLLGDDFKVPPKISQASLNIEKRSSAPLAVLKSNTNTNTMPSVKEGKRGKVMSFAAHGVLDEEVLLEKNRKNAIAARENRQKKKHYLESLERESAKLREENMALKNKFKDQQNSIERLAEEVEYLKSVIANQSTISLLLQNISATPGISLSSSLVSSSSGQTEKETAAEEEAVKTRRYSTRKRSAELSEVVQGSKKSRVSSTASTTNSNRQDRGGVCLHVRQNKVSLELCAQCNKKSQRN